MEKISEEIMKELLDALNTWQATEGVDIREVWAGENGSWSIRYGKKSANMELCQSTPKSEVVRLVADILDICKKAGITPLNIAKTGNSDTLQVWYTVGEDLKKQYVRWKKVGA